MLFYLDPYNQVSNLLKRQQKCISIFTLFEFNIAKIKSTKCKKNRQIQYHPAHMGNCGYRSDSTIDRKHFTGVDRTNNLRASHVNSSSHFNTGWQDITWLDIFVNNYHSLGLKIKNGVSITKCSCMIIRYNFVSNNT